MESDLDKEHCIAKSYSLKAAPALFLHQQARRSSLLSSSFAICDERAETISSKCVKLLLRKRRVVWGIFYRSAVPLSELKSIKPTSYRTAAIASLGE